MKILFADKFPEQNLQRLGASGHDCDYQPDLGAEDIPGKLAGHDALVVRSTRVDASAIEAAEGLKLIIRAGAGTNTIDKEAAAGKGVRVCNVPGKNALAVAELTLGLLLAIDRNIPDNVADLRAGKWNKKKYSATEGLFGRCIGIVGIGAIGLAVADRAAAFGMKVQVVGKAGRPGDVRERLAAIGAVEVADINELAERCSILSFHVPASEDTRGIVNEALLDRLAPGSVIINTSRGDVVDEQALIAAMDDKGMRAGLDVYRDEPTGGEGAFDSPLARHPNVYGTHHIGASTHQAQSAVAEGVMEIIAAFEEGRILHCVNMPN